MQGEFLQDLAIVMIVAGLVTILFHRMRQPVVLGYILAGFIVGPFTPFIPVSVRDRHTVYLMSELGMILLMFSLGLQFSLRKLARVGGTAVIVASIKILVTAGLGYTLGRVFLWSRMDSLFLAAILSISSTTIIIKALNDLKLIKEPFADIIVGILIVEDILAIAMLAFLSGISGSESVGAGGALLTLGKLGIFLASLLVAGLLAVPPLLRFVAGFKSNEMLLVAALGLCFGVSLLAMSLGYSVALGAFLIGAVMAEARERGRIETLIEPVRDMFSAVFFVAIGMLIQPDVLITYAAPTLLITLVVVAGKVMACTGGGFIAGHDARTAARVGMAMAPIGEFSFIIASLGRSLNVTSEFLYPIAVAVSAMTTLMSPYMIQRSDRFADAAFRRVPRPFADTARLYHEWVHRISAGATDNLIRRKIRRWMLQILLNMLLVAGIFIVAAYFARRINAVWPTMPDWLGGGEGALWLAAMVLSMPLLIVSHRKIRAVAVIGSEAATSSAGGKTPSLSRRALMAASIRILGTVGMATWILGLTTAIMPPWPVLVVLAAIVILIAAMRWQSFEKLYARAQLTLRDTLTRPMETERAMPDRAFPTVLCDAILETVEITESSPARGKLIRELQLRTLSGASAVAIERQSDSIINPGPDEELQTGDKVLLLGSEGQLAAALPLLTGSPHAGEGI